VGLAVVVPLEDPRGDVVEHLRTWTQSQTLARDRFQVILSADGRHPEFERQVAAELAPQDELVSAPGASLMGLYDAGARGARAPVLILTEAHVRADPECLAVVADAFAEDPDLDAATLRHIQSASSGISPLSERWFARSFDQWDRAGWRRLNTTGVAIRAEAYERVGGVDDRLGLYAPSLMSARLDQHGARIKHLDDAALTHELEQEMAYALELGGDFARGECVVRREQDPAFCERYFGPAGLWERRFAYREEISRPIVAALGSAIRQGPRDRRWLTRELLTRLPARVAGPLPRLAWERATTRVRQAVAATAALPKETRWHSYIAAHEGNVRAIQLEEAAGENGMPPPAPADGEPIRADRLEGVLIGTHGLEEQGGRNFRWTEAVSVVRLNSPPEGGVLKIDTGGLRGAPLGYLHGIYAGSHRLPEASITGDAETLELRLPADDGTGGDLNLVVICRPLVPARDGSSDPRRLGMPVFELELSAA
jgi:hypothetical protein